MEDPADYRLNTPPKTLIRVGKMLSESLDNINYVHPSSDVALTIDHKSDVKTFSRLICSLAYVGLQIRVKGFSTETLDVWDCFSDDIAARTGDISIGRLNVIDMHDYLYSKLNHKDLFQIYNFDSVANELIDKPIRNVRIDHLNAYMGGSNKHIIHCTETCGYEDFHLFDGGVRINDVTPWKNSYLISSTNAVNWIIGSPMHPVDPALIGGRAIRIDGRKPGSKPSKNITIHARPGLRLELDGSARAALNLIEYK